MSGKDRKLLLAVVAVLVLVFALVGSNVAANHHPRPHNLPVGIIGTPAVASAVAFSLGPGADEAYSIRRYPTVAAARAAIFNRVVYGAFQPGASPRLFIASAASPAVAAILRHAFAAPAVRAGRALAIRDLAPLPSSDSSGATAFAALLGLIIAGMMGSSLIYVFGHHRTPAVRLMAMGVLGVGAGLITALITNVIVGAFPSHFFAVWGVATLFVLAMGFPITAFQTLLGLGGTAIGAVLFLVIGNPASGGSSAPELLPAFWRELSQLLPPGAATTAMRDAVYFHGHGMSHALLVLGLYIVLGAAVALAVQVARARSTSVGG